MQQLGDVLVRVDAVTICGTDLHILRGDVPEVTAGRILGHEAVEPGGSGWVLGHTIDWAQAEFVRVPFADTSLHPLPDGNDESALSLADMIPPSCEVGVLNGHVRPGDAGCIVGTGPIELAAVKTARLFSPAHIVVIDPVQARLDAAKQFGGDVTLRPADHPIDAVRPDHRRSGGPRGHRSGGLGGDLRDGSGTRPGPKRPRAGCGTDRTRWCPTVRGGGRCCGTSRAHRCWAG